VLVLLHTLSSWISAGKHGKEIPGPSQRVKKMMMAEVANHSKRNHTDSYFSGKAVVTTSSEEFGSMTPKKPRNTSPRTSPVSPKEKKDKIGERVAALQQLVSPFGKTDTASVLQEASGYIKFLHQQLEVLSSPYMRAPPAAGAAPEVSSRRPSSPLKSECDLAVLPYNILWSYRLEGQYKLLF
jgi:hypothetical protein